jgi:hypothetical protein
MTVTDADRPRPVRLCARCRSRLAADEPADECGPCVLDRTSAILRHRGWTQGQRVAGECRRTMTGGENGMAVCMVTGMGLAIGSLPPVSERPMFVRHTVAASAAGHLVQAAVAPPLLFKGRPYREIVGAQLIEWNDARGRTADDVHGMLARVAKAAR